MKIKDILRKKGGQIITLHQDATLHNVIETLVQHNIGAILVVDDKENIVGIVSERDILHQGCRHCDKLREIRIKDVMTTNLIIGQPDDAVTYVKQIMIKNRIRHLPIFENKSVIGIISMRDIVEAELKEFTVENRYLRDYIVGKYPA